MHVALPKTRGSEKLPPSEQQLGFLAAGNDAILGYVGGFLITTSRGRPLEFHYSTPVKPSPTHRILYGPELEPYIFGELIGANLIRQTKLDVSFLLTDQPMLLGQRPSSSCPIICVTIVPVAPDVADLPNTAQLDFKSWPGFEPDVETLGRWLQGVNENLDLREPFGRVWEALRAVLGGESKQAA